MHLSDRQGAHAIRVRLELLGRTGLSVVYSEKGNFMSTLKAAGFWLDGEMYDRAAFSEDTSNGLKREFALYEALASYPRILECMGDEFIPEGEEAWALRLERSPHGNLREYIEKNKTPGHGSPRSSGSQFCGELGIRPRPRCHSG